MTRVRLHVMGLLACLALLAPSAAFAAGSYDSCTGFIDTLPATISAQGTWCLRKDLATSIAAGAAITVAANNVTIDCNGFKLGGLAAGDASLAEGIYAQARANTTIRDCNIRGFYIGIDLGGAGSGSVIEDNSLDQSLYTAIYDSSTNGQVRRNLVYDTGSGNSVSIGIRAAGDIVGNTVSGVFHEGSGGSVTGIEVLGTKATEVRDNNVSALVPGDGGSVTGIRAFARTAVIGNYVATPDIVSAVGIYSGALCRNNSIRLFSVPVYACLHESGTQSLNF
jgi:hypothetical protein